jgi:thioredoxin reductase
MKSETKQQWDCVVVGGGAAGLSAALVLGRARRRTLVVDRGEQSNLPAHGIGGLLGHDGRSPAELYEIGRTELGKYPTVEYRPGTVTGAGGEDGDFTLELEDGSTEHSKKVLLAGGMNYRFEDLQGSDELWGDTVFHCPFCHGWEVAGRRLAVRGDGDRGTHGALLLRSWSEDVVLLTDGPAGLDADQHGKLTAAGVTVDERTVDRLVAGGGALEAIAFTDGSRLERDGLLVAPRLEQRDSVARQLVVEAMPPGPMAADAIGTDMLERTSVPGVFAAGDLRARMPQVATAIASGSTAAAAVVQSLLADRFGLPVPPRE